MSGLAPVRHLPLSSSALISPTLLRRTSRLSIVEECPLGRYIAPPPSSPSEEVSGSKSSESASSTAREPLDRLCVRAVVVILAVLVSLSLALIVIDGLVGAECAWGEARVAITGDPTPVSTIITFKISSCEP